MSVYPYITAAGTDNYKKTIGTAQDAFETLNQFEQNDVIVSGGIESVVAGANIIVDNTDPLNPIVIGENGGVQTVTGGTNVTITGTAVNPIINANGVQSVTAGLNVTITGTPTDPIINSAGAAGAPTTITSEAGSFSLLSDPVGPDYRTKIVQEGPGILLTNSATSITVGLPSPFGFSATLIPNGANLGTITIGTNVGNFPASTVQWLPNWNDGNFNATTGVYTTTVAGRYLCMFQLSTSGQDDIGYVTVAGTTVFSSAHRASASEGCPSGAFPLELGLGSPVALRVNRTANILVYPQNLSAGAIYSGGTYFALYRLFS